MPIDFGLCPWKRFFPNQDELSSLQVENDLEQALNGVDALTSPCRHDAYRQLTPEQVVEWLASRLRSSTVSVRRRCHHRSLLQLGCEVKGLARLDIQRIKQSVRRS